MSKSAEPVYANRRKFERVDARIKVQFRSDREFATCYTQNLSKGGIYLETEDLPDPNATIALDLELPASKNRPRPNVVLIKGRVVRLMTVAMDGKTVHKVALQFVDLEPHVQILINQLFDELKG